MRLKARQLLTSLEEIRDQRPDFDDLDVHIEVGTLILSADYSTVNADGWAMAVSIVTDQDVTTEPMQERDTYVRIEAEAIDIHEKTARQLLGQIGQILAEAEPRKQAPRPRKRTVTNTRELREAYQAMQQAVEAGEMDFWTLRGKHKRTQPADGFFWQLAEAVHWMRLVLVYCGYGYSLAHLNVLANMWTRRHEITEADLDTLDRSTPVPDLETMAHLTSNVSRILGTRNMDDIESLE